jgi:hypothetical protein
MNSGRTVFSQLMAHLPMWNFRKCVTRYRGQYKVRSFSCLDQYLCMAFAQLTYRESLRDIEACLRAVQSRLYHAGIRARISRSTLADANEKRDWRIFGDFAARLIADARKLYAREEFGVQLDTTAYALDSTVINLCLSLFPWAQCTRKDAAIKLHTLLDLRGSIPEFVHVSPATAHDSHILDVLPPEPGSFYIMDRGYIDFARLYTLHRNAAFFVVRARANMRFRRKYSLPVEKTSGLRSDQIIRTSGQDSATCYPEPMRRICCHNAESNTRLVLLTNHFQLPAPIVPQLYKCRWQVELFFKWIKQHLRIKAFFGTSENAVKTQVWIAVSVYTLVAILKKTLALPHSLYTILQVLSVTLFEKTPLAQLLSDPPTSIPNPDYHNQQLILDL